jgi:hypothetical protein
MASRTNIAIASAFIATGAAVILLVPREDSRTDARSPGASVQGDGLVLGWGRAPTGLEAPPPDAGQAGSDPPIADGEISVRSLVAEMADLDHLARLPHPPFVAKQASSYDRRSKQPDDLEGWFANDDFVTNQEPNLVRVETAPTGERRYVLLDTEGPGAVVRLWTAAPAGTLRIFIDDDPRPALEAPMGALLGGRVEPFTPPFGQVTALGHSLYFPFPFRKRCRVTLDSIDSIDPFSGRTVDKLYYQIGYRVYAGARAEQVRPFSAAEVLRARPALARVATALVAGRPIEPEPPPGAASTTVLVGRTLVDSTHPCVTVVGVPALTGDAGGAHARAPLAGGALRTLRLSTPERDPTRLRATTLTITFDGEETVRAPLSDFFGSGPGWNPYQSLPMTIGTDGTLICRFRMPFRSRAIVTIARAASAEAAASASDRPWPPLEISGTITVDAAPFSDDTLLFHAGFLPPAALATRPIRDWHVAMLQGHGQQVGTVLSVLNPPGVAWWGEGDEKIFVDDETLPGLFGTGTEDYFGFAWSSTERFAHPYHAQTLAPASGFAGWFSMNRFLVVDPVPFAERLRFDLELWHWSDTTVEASALLYWYARPGGRDDFPR